MLRTTFFTLTLVSISAGTALADGIVFQLPKDGKWVRYQVQGMEVDARSADKEKYQGSLTVSSVGTENVQEEKCRWIEFRHTWQNTTRGDKDDRVRILKCLVPEKHLGKGKQAAKHVIRGWRSNYLGSQGKGTPYRLRRSDGTIRLGQPTSTLLQGPTKQDQKLEAKLISTKAGKFKCTGVRSRFEFRGSRTSAVTLTVWLNDAAPFGVVRFELEAKEGDGDKVTMIGTFEEQGKNATSDLPNK